MKLSEESKVRSLSLSQQHIANPRTGAHWKAHRLLSRCHPLVCVLVFRPYVVFANLWQWLSSPDPLPWYGICASRQQQQDTDQLRIHSQRASPIRHQVSFTCPNLYFGIFTDAILQALLSSRISSRSRIIDDTKTL